jgi:hypothetical protein
MTKWILPLAELLLLVCPMAANAQAVDPTGFTEQLNGVRQIRGLAPVAYQPEGVSVSQANNAIQRVRGLGHYVTGGFGQCAAIGTGDTAGALAMWLNSPPHAAIILSPALTAVGYANDGYAASVACSMGTTAPAASQGVQQWSKGPSGPAAPVYFQPRRGLFRRHR